MSIWRLNVPTECGDTRVCPLFLATSVRTEYRSFPDWLSVPRTEVPLPAHLYAEDESESEAARGAAQQEPDQEAAQPPQSHPGPYFQASPKKFVTM